MRTPRSRIFGDTEVPSQDLQDIKLAAMNLRQELRSLPENALISTEEAESVCRKVAVLDVPASLSGAGN